MELCDFLFNSTLSGILINIYDGAVHTDGSRF